MFSRRNDDGPSTTVHEPPLAAHHQQSMAEDFIIIAPFSREREEYNIQFHHTHASVQRQEARGRSSKIQNSNNDGYEYDTRTT